VDGIDSWEFLSWLLCGVDLYLLRNSELRYYWLVHITLQKTRLERTCVLQPEFIFVLFLAYLFRVPLLKQRTVEENIPKVMSLQWWILLLMTLE
jgi:hypothetical protein